MRVCVLTPVLDAFKGGNHLPLLAALPDVRFTVMTNRVKRSEHDALPSNVEIVEVPGRLGPYAYGIADARFAALTLRSYPPSHPFWKQFDVLHLNQVLGPRFLALHGSGTPVLYAIHHPVTADLRVALQESAGFDRLRWRLRYALPVRWQRSLCAGVSRIMTVSSTVRDRLAADYGCPAERVRIVPNGVDGAEFFPSDGEPEFDVIAVGSFLHPRKGFRYLAEAYRRLAASGARVADVGRRSQEQQDALRAIPGVAVFGPVDHDRLVSLVRGSAVLLSTSLYEGFGLSIIEALAAGRPAFAFAGGAVEEVLAPVDSQLIVPPRDVGALVARVQAFLGLPPDDRRARGAVYRERVLERYAMARAAEALRRLYRDVSG